MSIVQDPDLIHKIPLEDVRNVCIIAHIGKKEKEGKYKRRKLIILQESVS